MATVKYFNGEIELNAHSVRGMPNAEFAARFPGVKGRRDGGFHMKVGNPVDFVATFDREAGKWRDAYLPVERVITYKSNPSKHECDARCMNASGRTMNCECSCGGKNHGRGAFMCTEEAA
jgi:hypothetical protein